MRRLKLFLASASVVAALLWSLPVSAGTTQATADPFAAFTTLVPISDASLSTMLGRYVAPIQPHVPVQTQNALTTMPQPFVAQSGVRSPEASALSNLPAGGQVTYFGIEMVSSWSTATGSATVGATLGIDASTHTFTISNWSSSQGDALARLSTDGNANSSQVPSQNVNGVLQSIQVAGNGNTAVNNATLTVSSQGNGVTFEPTTTTCSSVCTTSVGLNSVDIAIQTGAGIATQQVGVNGISQTVRIAGDDNSIVNAMQLNAKEQLPSGFSAGSVLPILQTMNGFIP
jgi:hypothetical protein